MSGHAHAEGGASHGTVTSYITGFVLSAILTIIPFWICLLYTSDAADE